MQYPVPQFTDVEDRIIGGLTFKQFGIIIASGIFTFFIYTISKDPYTTVISGVLIGIPSLALAFGRMNGRPLYASIGNFITYLFGAKLYVFHKQVYQSIRDDAPVELTKEQPKADAKVAAVKIKELGYLLQQQASEESVLIERIKENQQIKAK